MRTVNILPTAISALAFFVALGGTGYALVNSSRSQGVIHACVDNKTGAVRIVRGPQACRHRRPGHPGERALTWNQTGPSDAYSASVAPNANGYEASVTVSPGDYIATGGCTASLDQTAGSTVPAFGLAEAALTTDPNFFMTGAPTTVTIASVPNAGENAFPGAPGSGSTSLSDSTGFRLPHGGTIFETCATYPGSHGFGASSARLRFSNPYVTAIRVGRLHQG